VSRNVLFIVPSGPECAQICESLIVKIATVVVLVEFLSHYLQRNSVLPFRPEIGLEVLIVKVSKSFISEQVSRLHPWILDLILWRALREMNVS
jgi:hypothetical protein